MACPTFRFLDLPVELRLIVYESIGFSSRKHILTKSASGLKNNVWPPGPTGASESSITLIVPEIPFGLLSTCRLVHDEAKDILAKNIPILRKMPLRYIVDWSAAVALMNPWGPLFHHYRGLDLGFEEPDTTTKSFISSRDSFLKGTKPVYDLAIEMVIDHKDQIRYGTEIGSALMRMAQYRQDNGYLFDVVCKSKLPKHRDRWHIVPSSSLTLDYLERLQRGVNTGPGPGNRQRGRYAVKLEPLSGKAFKRYLNKH